MGTPISNVLEALQEVLDLLTEPPSGSACEPLGLPPCRVSLYPGAEVPWDECGASCGDAQGQLYANLVTLTVQQEQPCHRITFTANVGILRCAAPMADDGTPPSEEALTQDAAQQTLDADAIWNVITCCADRSDKLRSIVPVTWLPLGPDGGCVGGEWTIRGVLDECC